MDSSLTDAPLTEPLTEPLSDRPAPAGHDAPDVEQDLLVEDVSIDGMCGVY